jgi:citrate lyase subunit beta/citryl-CoA lyase
MSLACRSYLFVPGHRPDRFDKAAASGVDAVVLDLEDAVPPPYKRAARDVVAAWLRPGRPAVVRINPPGAEGFAEDLAMCRASRVPVVMVPKAERPEDLAHVRDATGAVLLPLVETARGLAGVHAIAAVRGVQRLAFGSVDFQLDLDVDGDEALLPARMALVMASRLAGLLPPVDGVSTALKDPDRVHQDAAMARRLGFGAKLCIHPDQVEAVHRAFAPTRLQLEWAQAVVSASEASGGAAVQVQGRMVDLPVLRRARRMLNAHTGARHVSVLPARPLAGSGA